MGIIRHLSRAPLAPLVTLVAPALLLTGCVSFGAKPPKGGLLTLTTAAQPTTGMRSGSIANALIVQLPTAPQKLRTTRIPVQTGATAVAYVKDAQWVEPPSRMFQRVLTETIAASGQRLVLNESENVTGPGEVLTGELADFGVDADRREVIVAFNAIRIGEGGSAVRQQRFEEREAVATIDAASVSAALNRAANRVAGNVATWMAQ